MGTQGIRWILVPIDFSAASYAAARLGGQIASEVGASLHLLHATDGYGGAAVFGGAGSGTWWHGNESIAGVALAKKELAELAESFCDLGSRATHEVVSGKPLAGVRDAIRQGRGDLVVLGVHSQHHWWHLFAETTSDRAIRALQRPVIAVKEDTGAEAGESDAKASMQKIAVLTDFSHPSDAALDFAIGLAQSLHARLDLVHALALDSVPFFPYDATPSTTWCERARAEAQDAIRDALGRVHRAGLPGTGQLAECGPIQLATREPVRGADLVVVGTSGQTGVMGGFKHLVLGSVARGILHEARCSVAVVH